MRSFKDYLIFAGDESKATADELKTELGSELGEIKITQFPDTERLVKVSSNIKGRNVIYIKSTPHNKKLNQAEHTIELFSTIHAMVNNGVEKIILIIPYYAHARQDKKFKFGETNSAEMVAETLNCLGKGHIKELYTIDAHFNREPGKYKFFNTSIDTYNITAVKELAKYIKTNFKLKNPRIVIPDKGQQPTHEYIKQIFDTDFIFLSKQRFGPREVKITCDQDTLMLKDSDMLIFDDMISTGTTLEKSIEWLKSKNVNRIFIAATHLMYPIIKGTNDSEEIGAKLREAGATAIISADTTGIKENGHISIVPLIKKALLSQKDWA